MSKYDRYTAIIDEKKQELDACSDYLFDHPELGYQEFLSAAYLKDFLRREGFTVKEDLAGIKTAFSGSFGSGRPVVGLLGEFDALSGLSQEAGCSEQKPIPGQQDGHGCGHNLLGTGTLATALAVKRYLEETGASGTMIYFGCPAEEGGSGKTFMAADGIFDGLDFAVAWHPDASTHINNRRLLANRKYCFRFDGKASHASGAPAEGRSALDAVELMNVGVQFLREHMPSSARIHYAITDAGGISPNVVQPHAEVEYMIRGVDNASVAALSKRVIRIAEGAAMMTETSVETEFQKACSNTVCNQTLQRFMYDILAAATLPEPTEADRQFVRELLMKDKGPGDAVWDDPIRTTVNPYSALKTAPASSDVGDVSWICPTVRFAFAVWGRGTEAHDWLTVAQGKTPWAHEMMRCGAGIMAEAVIAAMGQPELIAAAWEEHKENIGAGYESPLKDR